MKASSLRGVVPAFLLALVFTTAWGSVVQTQFNLGALAGIGVDVGAVRWQATMSDLFSGFFPTYGGYVVLPALLVAFIAASLLARKLPQVRIPLISLAGGVALILAIPLVNALSPVALLVGASREWLCTLWMGIGGMLAGLLYGLLTRPPGGGLRSSARRRAHPAPG